MRLYRVRYRPGITVIALMLLAGCDEGSNSDPGDTTTEDAAGDFAGDVAIDGHEVVDAPEDTTSQTITLGFDAEVNASGSIRVGDVDLVGSAGATVILTEDVPTLAYEFTDWAAYGYTLFHLIAPQPDGLNVMYLYCTDAGLEWVWHEDYDLVMDFETGTGDCTWETLSTTVTVPALNTLTARPGTAQLADGFEITGTDVTWSGGTVGSLEWRSESFELYPFEVVDCSTECSADPADGWWELHSILSGPSSGTCFAILYLMKSNHTRVQLGYPVCFEPVRVFDPVYLTASWDDPLAGGGGSVPRGPRPEGMPFILRPRGQQVF